MYKYLTIYINAFISNKINICINLNMHMFVVNANSNKCAKSSKLKNKHMYTSVCLPQKP